MLLNLLGGIISGIWLAILGEWNEIFQSFIKEKKQLTNVQIIDFVAENCFITSYANDILKEMKKQNQVSVEYKKSDKIRGFYVADNNWDQDLATIIYRG